MLVFDLVLLFTSTESLYIVDSRPPSTFDVEAVRTRSKLCERAPFVVRDHDVASRMIGFVYRQSRVDVFVRTKFAAARILIDLGFHDF